jgi:hypothetical protein
VNSDHGVTLRVVSALTQRVSDLTKDPKDAQVADVAKKASEDHDAAQKTVNQDSAVAAEKGIPTP